jgi:hypothetical protein
MPLNSMFRQSDCRKPCWSALIARNDMEEQQDLNNSERLTSIFGCWPSFHDAEVIWLRLDRGSDGPTIESLIHTFEITNEVNTEGFLVLKNHVLVHLRFSGVRESKIDGFNCQNVLFGISISDVRHRQMEHLNFEVEFDSTFGVNVAFQCQDVEVVDVKPCDGNGVPLLVT